MFENRRQNGITSEAFCAHVNVGNLLQHVPNSAAYVAACLKELVLCQRLKDRGSVGTRPREAKCTCLEMTLARSIGSTCGAKEPWVKRR